MAGTAAATLALITVPLAGFAAEATGPRIESARTHDSVAYWSTEFVRARAGRNGYGTGAGFVTAWNGDIGVPGWIISSNLGFSRTQDAFSTSRSVYGTFVAGYQWNTPEYYFSMAAGAHYVDKNDTRRGSAGDGAELGTMIQYSFETKARDTIYLQSYGSASTAFSQIYMHAEVGYRTSALSYGPMFSIFDEEGSRPTLRYGVFANDIPTFGSMRMAISAGYQDELDPSRSDGFYATLGFSVPLSTR